VQVVWDVWRVLLISGTLLILGFTVLIVIRYGLLSRRRSTLRDHFLAHIFWVSLSYAVVLVMISVEQVFRLGHHLTWRLPTSTFVVVTGLFGVSNLWEHVAQGRDAELEHDS
jgi:hypothetical protein